MREPIFHAPTLGGVAFVVLCLGFSVAWNELLVWGFGFRLTFWNRYRVVMICCLLINTVVRDDIRCILNLVFLIWQLWGTKFPWDKWGKRLKTKVSSLTDVATAALRRQQSEAFS